MTRINVDFKPLHAVPLDKHWGSKTFEGKRYLSLNQDHLITAGQKGSHTHLSTITRKFNQALKEDQIVVPPQTEKSDFINDMEAINTIIESKRQTFKKSFLGLGKVFLAIGDFFGISTKKIDIKRLERSIFIQQIATDLAQVIGSEVKKKTDLFLLRDNFSKEIDLKMGAYMNPAQGGHLSQKDVLLQLFDAAMKTDNPRHSLEALINSKINQPGGWGQDKADNHIKKHLLPLMPTSSSSQPASQTVNPLRSQVQAIAQKPINAKGDKVVCFYQVGPTEFLGNFALCLQGINVFGQSFRCSEAAFQWRKFNLAAQQNNRKDMLNDPDLKKFFTCDGEAAFKLRRDLDNKYKKVFAQGWLTGARDPVMWEVLNAKFQQNPELRQLLDDTKGAYLLEHNQKKRDDYWSDDYDGTGKNILGKMLMAIRDNTPCPPVDDNSDAAKKQEFVNYANRSGALGYQIFKNP